VQLRASEFGLCDVEVHANRNRTARSPRVVHANPQKEKDMGKYFIAWLLGVPGIVLVLVYLFMH
jgi:hypothetical protein